MPDGEQRRRRCSHAPVRWRRIATTTNSFRAGDPGTYNQAWFDPGTRIVADRRTSLVIDPPDGRIPYTPAMRERGRLQAAYRVNGARNSWVDVDTGERCLTDGLPMFWLGYNPNHQIVQTPDHVVVLHEMFRDRRIIPLDRRPHGTVRQWNGNIRGRWEGDTLVVESISFVDRTDDRWAATWRMPTETMHLVERFTRIDSDTLEYEFTVTDPREVPAAVERAYSVDDQPGIARRDARSALRIRMPRGELQYRQRAARRARRGSGRRRGLERRGEIATTPARTSQASAVGRYRDGERLTWVH